MLAIGDDEVHEFERDGVIVVDRIIDTARVGPLRARFDSLFRGEFETGVAPDEVNWQHGSGDPSLTRQICNGWKADSVIASIVLDPTIGAALAQLGRWTGARLIQDNMLWKPPGARPLGYHRDNAYSLWFTPTEMLSCWIALDDTAVTGGTMEVVRGSHRWPVDDRLEADFHGPADYRLPVTGHETEIVHVEVAAGGGSFHHGWSWHGSGSNLTESHRRALVIHAAPIEARFDRLHLNEGMGHVYSRYCGRSDDRMPDAHFPVLWQE